MNKSVIELNSSRSRSRDKIGRIEVEELECNQITTSDIVITTIESKRDLESFTTISTTMKTLKSLSSTS
ncbi:CLUMA_CG001515, isoform A [Clunio marinus]|uniref:CLUMA_CG001515, isoform A n=1 Tax=Clunio marinus TaxID=568069 RepID=A0A1J1HI86_9DIPT|nr:CLUMA_CG001515, isoform A [Clunio marinus]